MESLQLRRDELKNVTQTRIQESAASINEEIRYIANRCSTLKGHMTKISKEKLPSRVERPQIYECVDKIAQLEKALAYLKALKFVKESSERIEANLESGLNSEAIDLYHLLVKLQQSYMISTECINFRNYFDSTIQHWGTCLKNTFTRDFEKLLDAFGWPSNIATSTPTLETHEKFHKTIRNMVRISVSITDSKTVIEDKPSLVTDFKEPLLPVHVMVQPLKKRFKYHFFANKITSDPKRPEWYFTQIKIWARELIPFIRTHLEPMVSEAHLSCVADFLSSLSEILILKADSQLTAASGTDQVDDTVFARILEESIIYENEVSTFLGEDLIDKKIYIPPFVSTLFSQPHVLQRWLAIERKACLEKLDEIFSSPTAWDRAVESEPAEVVDLFMAVLRFVTDRFAHLQEQSQKVLFLQLLVDMIDDFRVRCLQTWKSRRQIEADYKDGVLIDYIIADTLHSVQKTIESWEDLPFFATMSFFLDNSEDYISPLAYGDSVHQPIKQRVEEVEDNQLLELPVHARDDPSLFTFDGDLFRSGEPKDEEPGARIGSPSQGVFSHVLKLYECLNEDILRKWCTSVISKLRSDIKIYSRRKWHIFPPDGFEENGETLSEGLLNVVQRLKALSKGILSGMNSEVAQIWLKRLAIQFDEMIMETLVYSNRFTPVGINSALRIWEMPLGRAILLYDALTDPSTSFEFQEDTLAELELSLRPSDIIKLLKSRTDINF
ncbi:unnamed protein product [Allacma fusca]|uniref:RAD50-interacting protein 1 n=1 Tax=Allacma fusca TaxID=39272 RepID=A0A8J2JBX0_9HEXA|nr:unnamed protein product [Allacma fusca]